MNERNMRNLNCSIRFKDLRVIDALFDSVEDLDEREKAAHEKVKLALAKVRSKFAPKARRG